TLASWKSSARSLNAQGGAIAERFGPLGKWLLCCGHKERPARRYDWNICGINFATTRFSACSVLIPRSGLPRVHQSRLRESARPIPKFWLLSCRPGRLGAINGNAPEQARGRDGGDASGLDLFGRRDGDTEVVK